MTRPDNGLQTLRDRPFDDLPLGVCAIIEHILNKENIQQKEKEML